MNCFIIMPFSDTKHFDGENDTIIDFRQWTFIYNDWIKKAVESYPNEKIKCKRSTATPGNFVKGIIKDIYSSDIVIADLTGQKPNVYYELGIRHSLKLGTIIITQDLKAIPSDLASYYCFGYNYTDKTHLFKEYFEAFEKELHDKITHILLNNSLSDNPVADFLDLNHYYQSIQKKKQIALYKELLELIRQETSNIFSIFKTVILEKEEYISKNKICFVFFDLMYFDLIFQRFSILNFNELEISDISFPLKEIKGLRAAFLHILQYWEGSRNNISIENTTIFLQKIELLLEQESRINSELENLKNIVG